jgi:23S rRNA (cytidine1920-2'-O)/16S rRNA (cytidine1409-2'-O)-methyltransferase
MPKNALKFSPSMPPKSKSKTRSRIRLDQLLFERGDASSLAHAQALILSGNVLVNDDPHQTAGALISPSTTSIRLRNQSHPYVSRGALKLLVAIETFSIQVSGKVALDVGSSTGGFTEVLLAHGAEKVYAVDVGTNQLDWKIRNNPKVVSMEKTNVRGLSAGAFSEPVELIVMDVSFVSATKIIPTLVTLAAASSPWVLLIKPQFEVEASHLGKGGIVLNNIYRQEAIDRVLKCAESLGRKCKGLIESPIEGTKGNKEFLAHF